MQSNYYQTRRTVETAFQMSGVGLHTGEQTSISIQPAESEQGIQFDPGDSENSEPISALYSNVVDTRKSTVLGTTEDQLSTVEHLLSAVYALGITDISIAVNGPEIPALDGGALTFVEKFREAGLQSLEGTKNFLRVEEPIAVQQGKSSLVIIPSTELSIDLTISYENSPIHDQFYSYELAPDSYAEEIAPARTYGFKHEVEELLEEGMAQGGSLDNALLVDSDGNYVGDGPRMSKEMARHKILDLIGDLCLSGYFVVGKIIAVMPSHEINTKFVRKIREEVAPLPDKTADQESSSSLVDGTGLEIEEILDVLPHRYPFLLIDRVLSVNYDQTKAVGFKNVTINEEYFQGHFPDDPVMPGVLIVEAMAQLGAACILNKPEYQGKNSYFMGLDDVKWRRPVRPGDRVYFEIEGQRMRSKYGVVDGKATVDGELAAEATVKFAIVDP